MNKNIFDFDCPPPSMDKIPEIAGVLCREFLHLDGLLGLVSSGQDLASKLDTVYGETTTYRICQDSIVYDIKMPKSKTFDAYLSYPDSDGDDLSDGDVVSYDLTPIDDLKVAIETVMSPDPALIPSSRQLYILNFLGLQPTISTFSDINISDKILSAEMCISSVGSILHGQSTFKGDFLSGDILTVRVPDFSVALDFNYGLLHGPKAVEQGNYYISYHHGRQITQTFSWDPIVEMIYMANSDCFFQPIGRKSPCVCRLYTALRTRLITDRVIDRVTRINRDVIVIREDLDIYKFVFTNEVNWIISVTIDTSRQEVIDISFNKIESKI